MDIVSPTHPPVPPNSAVPNHVSSHARDAPASPSTTQSVHESVSADPGVIASTEAPANSNPSPLLLAWYERPSSSTPSPPSTPYTLPPTSWSFDSAKKDLHPSCDSGNTIEKSATTKLLESESWEKEHLCQDKSTYQEKGDRMASMDAQNVSKGDEGMLKLPHYLMDGSEGVAMDCAALRKPGCAMG